MLLVLNDAPAAPYRGDLMFTAKDENSPDAAFIVLGDPLKNRARIRADVTAGSMVITRGDAVNADCTAWNAAMLRTITAH